MRPLVTSLLAKLAEMYLGFNKIEEVIQIYEETRANADEWFQLVYDQVVSLTNRFGTKERKTRFNWQQINGSNIPSEAIKQHWQISVHLPFLDIASAAVKLHFSQEKRSHYERCRLIPEVFIADDKKL